MKRRALALSVVAALSAAGIAYAVTSPSGLPKGDAVFGGGHFTFVTDHNFSLTASGGTGTLQYSVASIRVEITCSQVAANAAVIGGIIRDAANTSLVGDPVLMYFVDNGPPAGTAVGGDSVSPLNVFGPGENAGGLPKVCPVADATQATLPLDAGDIVVHAAKT